MYSPLCLISFTQHRALRFICVAACRVVYSFLSLSNIPLCEYILHLIFAYWAFRLFSVLHYYVFIYLEYIPQNLDAVLCGKWMVNFLNNCQTASLSSYTTLHSQMFSTSVLVLISLVALSIVNFH